MLAGALDTCRKTQHLVIVEPFRRNDGNNFWLTLSQGARLVDDEGVNLLHPLQRLGIFDQHASLCATANSNHNRHRRCQA